MGKIFKNKHIWGDLTVALGQNFRLSSSLSDGETIDQVNINVPAALKPLH